MSPLKAKHSWQFRPRRLTRTSTRCAKASRSPSTPTWLRPRNEAALSPRSRWLCCGSPDAPDLPCGAASLDGWQTVETRGVRLLAQASAEELDALAQDLSGFHAAFSFLIGREIPSTGRTTIALIRDPGSPAASGSGRALAGFAWTTFDGAFAFVLLDPSRVETRITLFHEYMHLLLWRHRSALIPRWYTEGLADYFSTVAFRDGALVVGAVPAGASAGWSSVANRCRSISCSGATGRRRCAARRSTTSTRPPGRSRTISWHLRRARRAVPLREGARERHAARCGARSRVRAFVRAPDRGAHDPCRLSRARCRRRERARPAPGPRPPAVPRHADEPGRGGRRARIARADVGRRFRRGASRADTARSRGRTSRSRSKKTRANARTRAALARARALGGDAHGAEELLASALRDAPADPQVQLDAGHVALAAGAAGEAQARFRQRDRARPAIPGGLVRARPRARARGATGFGARCVRTRAQPRLERRARPRAGPAPRRRPSRPRSPRAAGAARRGSPRRAEWPSRRPSCCKNSTPRARRTSAEALI